jgi:hypothetical protein
MVDRVRLAQQVASVDRVLSDAGIPHAFGGALALAYYAEPRATADIDVNVFVPAVDADGPLDVIAFLGIDVADARRYAKRDGQCRVRWGETPIDLFFSSVAFHDAMRKAARTVPGRPTDIEILAPEHLLVCKARYNRDEDWLDIKQMLLFVPNLRTAEVMRWMRELAGDDDQRTQRVRAMITDLLGDREPE